MASIAFEITEGLSAQKNMDLDRENLLAGRGVLRFYSWTPPGISLGISEDPTEVVDMKRCDAEGVEVVSRLTGGAAVLHRDDFTYSIILPRDRWPKNSLHAIYDIIAGALELGLRSLQVEVQRADAGPWRMPETHVCFQGPAKNEILVQGRKIVGSAQCHKRRAILQHGSVMIKNHTAQLCRLLKLSDEKQIEDITSKTISLEEALGDAFPCFNQIAEVMHGSFSKVLAEHGLDLEPLSS